MKLNPPGTFGYIIFFAIGFSTAWLIRTPLVAESHNPNPPKADDFPRHVVRPIKPNPLSNVVPKPPAIPAMTHEQEKAVAHANAELMESQDRLANAREAAFKGDPDLSYAYEASRTYHNWQQRMGDLTSEARSWWSNQRTPANRAAMREVTRKILIQEIASRLGDPASREWMIAWFEQHEANNEQKIRERQSWWSEDYVSLPNFLTLPPPEVLAAMMNPATSTETLARFQITDEERKLIKPSVFFFLEGSAQAGVIAQGGMAYYNKNKGSAIASLESRVEIKNRHAVDLSNRTGNPP